MRETISITFDKMNVNWIADPVGNQLFLTAVMNHMQNVLDIRGIVFLNDVYDQLRVERTNFGQTHGWYGTPKKPAMLKHLITGPLANDNVFRIEFDDVQDILHRLP